MGEFKHISVLLNECIENLNIKKGGIYVDGTLGGAGHSYHILKNLNGFGSLYCFDQDIEAIEASSKRLSSLSLSNYKLIHSNFRFMKQELEKLGVDSVDGILFDLGVSSYQLDEGERGFSYNYDALLDMRMDQSSSLTAKDVVNRYSEAELTKIFFEYGEEKFSKRIAANIVKERKNKEICTTFELVDIIRKSLPVAALREKGHPAKRVFQAIRIEVNGELSILKESLANALKLLKPKGRMCVITFHSLEDRIVKSLFNEVSSPKSWNRNMPVMLNDEEIEFKLVNKKPILPSQEELEVNNRAHSAKLRVIEKL
ncbi:MAG: 16S rRNA (cytosine(1402)-N(4))-methyltransferase RsmH [Bacilli bacterium]|nr:16S rRNA (cytosine(1402)-N(4))-methyltransferase RsmH [Bacilli bacterium]